MKIFDSVSIGNVVWGFTGGYSLNPESVQIELADKGLKGVVLERTEFDVSQALDPRLEGTLKDTHTIIPEIMCQGDEATRSVLEAFGIDTQDRVYVYRIKVESPTTYAHDRPSLKLSMA